MSLFNKKLTIPAPGGDIIISKNDAQAESYRLTAKRAPQFLMDRPGLLGSKRELRKMLIKGEARRPKFTEAQSKAISDFVVYKGKLSGPRGK